jgi:hypothetical protein
MIFLHPCRIMDGRRPAKAVDPLPRRAMERPEIASGVFKR